MTTEKKKETKRRFDKRFFVFLFLAIIFLCIFYYLASHQQEPEQDFSSLIIFEDDSSIAEEEHSSQEQVTTTEQHEDIVDSTGQPEGILYIHMIDCGQGDCFLFEENGKYALIDCGTRSSTDEVADYLKNEQVDKFEFIVGTHQHDDHMGGMNEIISNYECETIYMPKIKSDIVTANWYLQLMSKIKKDKIKVVNPQIGDTFYLEDAKFTVIGQLSSEEAKNNVNDYSTVIHVSYGDMDFVFTGDAETKVERQMLDMQNVSECEVLKAGHHGSDTSTSKEFLEAVNPKYCLISCGVGNKYEHPCTSTMKMLKKEKVEVYRTDELGSVVLEVTANDITFSTKPGDYKDGVTVAKKRKG